MSVYDDGAGARESEERNLDLLKGGARRKSRRPSLILDTSPFVQMALAHLRFEV